MAELIVSIAQWVWNGLQAVADAAVVALEFAWRILKAFAIDIWDAAKWTYQTILKPVGEFLHKAYDKLKAVYDKVLKPIHDWAQRITKALRTVYNTYFRPILSAIDGVRRIVELLALLHVSWAKELDDALAALERKIAAPILETIRVVNLIDSRIEAYILTADNLFRKATLIGSIKRDLNPILNLNLRRMLSTIDKTAGEGPTGMQGLAAVDDDAAFFEASLRDQDDTIFVTFDDRRTFSDLFSRPV